MQLVVIKRICNFVCRKVPQIAKTNGKVSVVYLLTFVNLLSYSTGYNREMIQLQLNSVSSRPFGRYLQFHSEKGLKMTPK